MTRVPGRFSDAGELREPGNTRKFQGFGPITESVDELVDVRRAGLEIGVAKSPLCEKFPCHQSSVHGRLMARTPLNPKEESQRKTSPIADGSLHVENVRAIRFILPKTDVRR